VCIRCFRCDLLGFQVVPPHFQGKAPTKLPEGSFVFPIIPPNHHIHGLVLSGPCQPNKSEFLPNQHPPSAPFHLYGQVWNDDFLAESPIAAPDPEWWTDNINSELVSSDVQVYQECQVAPASVSLETPCVNEVGTDSLSAEFQPANLPFGDSQQLFDFNFDIDFDIDFEQNAFQAHPNGENCIVAQNSSSPSQSDRNSFDSSSTPPSVCDFSGSDSRVSTPPRNETLSQESQQNGKRQISVLHSFKCPHCPEIFSSEQRIGFHIQNSYKHLRQPNICAGCGHRFTLSKDLKRHLQSVSCRKGTAPKRPFACKCGKDYSRKDHLLRHINKSTRRPEDEKKHYAVPVRPNN